MRQFFNRVFTKSALLVAGARNESGQALIEYALIISLISVVAIAGLSLTGQNISSLLTQIANEV